MSSSLKRNGYVDEIEESRHGMLDAMQWHGNTMSQHDIFRHDANDCGVGGLLQLARRTPFKSVDSAELHGQLD